MEPASLLPRSPNRISVGEKQLLIVLGRAMENLRTLSGRIETAYLSTLRFVVLIVATLFVLSAGVILINGLQRLLTSTEVAEEPVTVIPGEVLASVATKKDVNSAASSSEAAQAAADKKIFDRWKSGTFAAYHQSYVALARRYNKPEDQILTRDQFAEELGYTVDAYQTGDDDSVRRFVNDPSYAAQLTATAKALPSDRRVVGQLQQYRAAQKTAQTCTTDYVARRMWDSNATSCSNWYEYPQGCAVVRDMPVQRCVPAYPEGITSPAQAFAQMDLGFRSLWTSRQTKNSEDAAAKREALQAKQASGMPTLVQALQVFGAFLIVMFVFLVIAIERHLRRIAQTAPPSLLPAD